MGLERKLDGSKKLKAYLFNTFNTVVPVMEGISDVLENDGHSCTAVVISTAFILCIAGSFYSHDTQDKSGYYSYATTAISHSIKFRFPHETNTLCHSRYGFASRDAC